MKSKALSEKLLTFNHEDNPGLHLLYIFFFFILYTLANVIVLILQLLDNHVLIFLSLSLSLKVLEVHMLASNTFLLSPKQTQDPDCAPNQILLLSINCYFVDVYFNVFNKCFSTKYEREQLACSEHL